MTTDVFHPDHLRPGSMVGPWRILKSLGSGGMGHVFQVEQEGETFALKVALRPASEEVSPHEEDIDRRMGHEAAFHLSHESLPGVLRVVEVSRWPRTRDGYRILVTEYVEGETFHEWRLRTRPSAAKLLEVFEGLVRTVAELHRRGIHHRDLKATNILVSREEERPYLIDFGMVSLPGAATLTQAGLVGTLHTVPPEMLAFFRAETWRQGARFRGGAAGDLYALGVLLYEALTDCHPFDPKLPMQELVAAIEAVMPPAPHELVPEVPRALSRIALHLLAKTPEARLPSAEALLQALWDAKKEARTPAWRAPLPLPPEGMGRQRTRLAEREAPDKTPASPESPSPSTAEERHGAAPEERRPPAGILFKARVVLGFLWAFTPKRVRWLMALTLGLLLALFLVWATFAPPPQKGSAPVSPHDSRFGRLLALLCTTTTTLGCPGAQVKPPAPERCPEEARKAMFEELGLKTYSNLSAIIDVNQPPDPDAHDQSLRGTYRDGPIVGMVEGEPPEVDPRLPAGTLLYGQLWTGPDVLYRGDPAITGRYTRARLPDGRTYPVCIVLGSTPSEPSVRAEPGPTPGTKQVPRVWRVFAVERWP